jgi:hypothetical protein
MTSGCRGEAGERGGDKALEHNEDVMGEEKNEDGEQYTRK